MPAPNIQYENLRAEMSRRNLMISDIAAALSVTRETAGKKLARKYGFTLHEAFLVLKLFPGLSLEYLFQEEKV